jgi:hypothetical protein
MSHLQAFQKPVFMLSKSALVLALLFATFAAHSAPVNVNAGPPNGQTQQINPGQVPNGLTADEWGSIQEQILAAQDAAYPLTAAPLLHGEAAILRASDAQVEDYFGESVSISGDTLVAGAPEEDGGAGDPFSKAGAAYVFILTFITQ